MERLWRVRKDHVWIDARLRPAESGPGVALLFFFEGELLVSRACGSRPEALDYAAERLRELQRVGWNTHW